MPDYYAVIGSNYGDEGKGRTVDYLTRTSPDPVLVVRHNSSAQAGHTVQVGKVRHVFSHFGSGTLRGAPTYLGHKFVINPIAFNYEWDELQKIGITPTVYVQPDLRVTTPLDTLLNQLTEAKRGDGRHGSCGLGFGETIQRYELNPADRELYFAREVQVRGLENVGTEKQQAAVAALRRGEFHWGRFHEQLTLFAQRIKYASPSRVAKWQGRVIFEGAQGLLLHQDDEENFPHVTRCRTGLQDVAEFLDKIHPGSVGLKAYYCTRPYLTRHGAGPLPHERRPDQMRMKGYDITDPTNVPNEYQGSLRFSDLDSFSLGVRVQEDTYLARRVKENLAVDRTLMINCADQAAPGKLERIAGIAGEFSWLTGWGPDSKHTSNDIKVPTPA